MERSLRDITVVALEQAVAAPLCTARLADAGARVIKIERAVGDFARDYDDVVHGESAYFAWLNRGKQSIALDLKDATDCRLLHRLIGSADIFVQNLAPGAAARAGFASAMLRKRHEQLITVDISGYGDGGAYSDMKAYDLLVQCEAGLASITGSPDAPGRVGVSVADICCGMNAHAAVLQALYARGRDGRGAGIEVSLFDGLADWMTVPLLHHDYSGKAPERVGLAHPSIAPYGEFALSGGASVVIAVQNDREWHRLCEMLERTELLADGRFATNVGRCRHRAELDLIIEDALSNFDKDTLPAKLKEAGIAFGFVNSVAQFSQHPQLRRVRVESPSGPVDLPAPPVRWSGIEPALGGIPSIDEHGPVIRTEFG